MKFLYLSLLTMIVSTSMFAQTSPRIPATGLIASYPFTGNANDCSGNRYNMTVHGATLCTDRFGDSNTAYQFNGIDNSITYSDVLPTVSDFTYSCWVSSSVTQNAMIFNNGDPDVDGYGFTTSDSSTFYHIAGNNITIQAANVGYFGTHVLPNDGWHNFILRVTGGNVIDYFFDGKRISTVPFSFYTPTGIFMVGRDYTLPGFAFDGKVDDISVYNRSVDSLEILQLYYGCYKQIVTQPISDSIMDGGIAKMFINTTDTFHQVQWQINTGSGFVNITSVGPFEGTNTDTLIITSPPSEINNSKYRCIVTNAIGCKDTSDIVTLKIGTTAVNEIEKSAFIKAYPNPATDRVMVELPTSINAGYIQILNVTGQVISRKEISGKIVNFDLKDLSTGIYFIEVNSDGNSIFKKMIKN